MNSDYFEKTFGDIFGQKERVTVSPEIDECEQDQKEREEDFPELSNG